MATKPKTKTKKTTEYVDLNEILDHIATSIEALADKELIIREATGSLAERVAQIQDHITKWHYATISAWVVAGAALILAIIK